MGSVKSESVPERVFCKIFNREIDYGLCWDIANVGDDSLMLRNEEIPPCGWDQAHKICDKCPEYIALSE